MCLYTRDPINQCYTDLLHVYTRSWSYRRVACNAISADRTHTPWNMRGPSVENIPIGLTLSLSLSLPPPPLSPYFSSLKIVPLIGRSIPWQAKKVTWRNQRERKGEELVCLCVCVCVSVCVCVCVCTRRDRKANSNAKSSPLPLSLVVTTRKEAGSSWGGFLKILHHFGWLFSLAKFIHFLIRQANISSRFPAK